MILPSHAQAACRRLGPLAGALLLVIGIVGSQHSAKADVPKAVLLLDQSDPNAPWGIEFRASFRAILSARTPPVSVYLELADLGRFDTPEYEGHLRDYLRGKYRSKSISVVVVNGSRMFQMGLRLHKELWPQIPMVFATVDQTAASEQTIPPGVTGAVVPFSLRDAVKAARTVVPNLKTIVHVGDHWERQPFFSKLAADLPELEKEIEFINLAGLSMPEIRSRVSALPADSAIVYTSLYVDGAGTSFAPIDAVRLVAQVANRPMLVFSEVQIGYGATGGYVTKAGIVGEDAARRALRILGGEDVSSIPITVGDFVRPIFDWRELRRFGVSERSLPPGSEIRFKTPTIWEQYRWQMTTIMAVVLTQALMIAGLLFERHRRRTAENTSRARLLEVMHLNRTATAGAMSAAIAHELNQPLGAILSNAEAAKTLLTRDPLDVRQIKEIVEDIRLDDQRAADIIKRLRGLLKRKDIELQHFDLNDTVMDTLRILNPEAARRGIEVITNCASGRLPVRADQVHMQQVLLNLATNGMDAIQEANNGERTLTIETARNGGVVEMSIHDTGAGVPSDKLEAIFETFVTTKPQGTGLGLSIARTIVETYGGRIWCENRPAYGATFLVTLPLADAHA